MEYHKDSHAFAEAMDKICILFDKPFKKEQVRAFFDALSDLPIDAVLHGFNECQKNEARFPPPAKVREHANAQRKQQTFTTPRISLRPEDQDSDYAKRCAALIQDLFDDKITKNEYLVKAVTLCEEKGYDSSELQAQWKG